jgi:peptidyl-prolyl cis-trans isomerase SurA
LREDAYIDIRAGYMDSGASPKETKPVFTAYTPPVAKKKTVQQKKRFDRGTTFSTASKSAAPVAPAAAPSAVVATPPKTLTNSTTAEATAATKPQKPQKVKREKVRFGQAPRNTLPAGPEETASGTDVGEGAASAAVTPGGTMAASAAPGTAIAPLDGSGQVSSSSNTDPNPLEAHPAVEGKTRYSARAKQVRAEKKTTKLKKVNEKKAAAPAAPTTEEKAAEQTQAAPLGLNGDTQKKKKQPKDKNAPKERLQNKAPTPAPPPPDETPSKAPNRATPLEGTLPPAPKSSDTTVPPTTGTPPTTPPQQ